MKKSIIALAVAASTLGVAQADGTVLYGSARFHYTYSDNSITGGAVNPGLVGAVTGMAQGTTPNFPNVLLNNYLGNGVSGSKVANKSSRFGIRGSNDLGNGLTAGYQFELGIDNNSVTTRDLFANIGGDFGTIQVGRFTLPYEDVVSYTDIFNGVGGGYALRDWGIGALPGRANNVFAYVSPNFNGFQGTAGVIVDGGGSGSSASNDHVDGYQLTAAYDNNGIHAALGYAKFRNRYAAIGASTNSLSGSVTMVNGQPVIGVGGLNVGVALPNGNLNQDITSLNASVGYSNEKFMVGLSAERTSIDNVLPGIANPISNTDPLFVNLAGRYNIDESNSVYGSIGMYDYDRPNNTPFGVQPDRAKAVGIGYQHNFDSTTRVWAEYQYLDSGANDWAAGSDAKSNTLSLGLRTDF